MLSKTQMILMTFAALYLYQQQGVPATYIGAGAVALIVGAFLMHLLKTLIGKGILYGGVTALVSQLTGFTLETSLYLVLAALVAMFLHSMTRR